MIEFISYDGEYPNLCSGLLLVNIDGAKHAFCSHETHHFWTGEKRKKILEDDSIIKVYGFDLISGGSCPYNEETEDYDVEYGEWEIDVDDLRYENDVIFVLSDRQKKELRDCVNENVEEGCCGGCI